MCLKNGKINTEFYQQMQGFCRQMLFPPVDTLCMIFPKKKNKTKMGLPDFTGKCSNTLGRPKNEWMLGPCFFLSQFRLNRFRTTLGQWCLTSFSIFCGFFPR